MAFAAKRAGARRGKMADRLAMDGGRYSWETAVLDAFAATPEAVASKIDVAKQAIAERVNGEHPPDACETSVLMYALDALETLGALGAFRLVGVQPPSNCG
jgi:hypothetical protein